MLLTWSKVNKDLKSNRVVDVIVQAVSICLVNGRKKRQQRFFLSYFKLFNSN